jgi:hypothetical protein
MGRPAALLHHIIKQWHVGAHSIPLGWAVHVQLDNNSRLKLPTVTLYAQPHCVPCEVSQQNRQPDGATLTLHTLWQHCRKLC